MQFNFKLCRTAHLAHDLYAIAVWISLRQWELVTKSEHSLTKKTNKMQSVWHIISLLFEKVALCTWCMKQWQADWFNPGKWAFNAEMMVLIYKMSGTSKPSHSYLFQKNWKVHLMVLKQLKWIWALDASYKVSPCRQYHLEPTAHSTHTIK